MKQVYHSNATTNIRLRLEINKSKGPNNVLAEKFGVSENTILKWENIADQEHSNRWLILIAYLMGLSIGVHLLNLLAIPAIVFVYYFKKYPVSRNGILAAAIVSVVILLTTIYGILDRRIRIG